MADMNSCQGGDAEKDRMVFTAKEIALVLRAVCRLENDYFNDDYTATEIAEEIGPASPAEWEALCHKLELLPRQST